VEAASSRGILAPLEKALKFLLVMFHKVIPNYGIAIILLTLFIKLLFFPLTKKGSEATLRMQALSPKIKEIQDKYKDKPQVMQAKMAEFYKQEGYNPLAGCLPMLLQLPIFIAMYNLFNNHFDLRGAEFIPGWIPDLSVPEAVVNFPEGFRLPILGWTALRALPFIYVASQLLYGKVTQVQGQQSNTQMKMMLYVMPIVFFFVLYNVPSGLLLYWIFSNLLTLVQQVIINKFIMSKRAQTETQLVVAPAKAAPPAAVSPSSSKGTKQGPSKKKKRK
jgi:YidC/Oxa1 family membrane protein insertase